MLMFLIVAGVVALIAAGCYLYVYAVSNMSTIPTVAFLCTALVAAQLVAVAVAGAFAATEFRQPEIVQPTPTGATT